MVPSESPDEPEPVDLESQRDINNGIPGTAGEAAAEQEVRLRPGPPKPHNRPSPPKPEEEEMPPAVVPELSAENSKRLAAAELEAAEEADQLLKYQRQKEAEADHRKELERLA